jgi:DNA-binding NtrC family response regulator
VEQEGMVVHDRPTLAELERRYAAQVLQETGGNKTRAAEILGIDRKTLYRLLGERDEK